MGSYTRGRAVTQLTRFIAGKTKLELMKRAVDGRLMIAPLYSMADILDDRQLASRDYWETVGGVRHPGPFARLTQTPISGTAAAPQLGADQAILAPAPAAERRPVRGGRTSRSPFDGLKVADFAWSAAGPLISKALADHGATVVHIESETRVDYLRLVPPYKDDIPGVNRNHIFTNYNTSKLSLALNLATDRGRHIARKMADWADVVVESFIPGVMERHGLSYRELSANHPNLVMISSTLRGQTGPEKLYSGFGGQGGALAGFEAITGWPDRAPCGVWGAYTDLVSPRPGVAALTAALLHRLRTGQGQYIDLSQVESSLHILGPVVLDYSVNGRVWGLRGQDSPYACPQGVYQAAGDQRFVAIAVESPDQWRALVKTANLGFTGSEFEQESVRRLHDGPVAAELRAWCVERDAFEMAEMLRAAGVPASPVLRMTDVYRDPQLWGRGHFITLDHGELGPTIHEGLATKFSKHGDSPLSAGPTLGQHTNHVLRDLLGLSEHEIADCAAAGALQ